MENRYLSRQGSGVWRSFRYGDFEEEDVWDVIRDRKNSNTMPVRSKESSVSVPRRLPTASRMIPRASSHNYGSGSSYSSSNNTHEAKIVQQSAPVHIPSWSKANGQKSNKGSHNSSWHNERDDSDDDDIDEDGDHDDEDEEEEEDDYNAKEPPHEFLARRLARSQISSFSVFEGAGRTLKGRDLSKVRNAVLTKTGFLESL